MSELKRTAPFACGFCGRNYLLPKPRACCERGRNWDLALKAAWDARVAARIDRDFGVQDGYEPGWTED